ncbi:MAG: P1 family peptidase [Pyrinomonadaceae bacterium]
MGNILYFILITFVFTSMAASQSRPRARDIGVPFDGKTGELNAITDIRGVEVGFTTLVSGQGKKAVRTGVTAILPRGKDRGGRVFAAWDSLNGNGEMTGTTWIEESGGFGGPIMITNTHSVGIVRDAVIEWGTKRSTAKGYSGDFSLPVVAETWDGFLNDINGFHIKKEHVFRALDSARSGPVAEGNVGGGTGMVAHQFKAGTGTASRVLKKEDGGYTIGVLVQANYGSRRLLRIAGAPVGKEITELMPTEGKADDDTGSIIVVVATDAPLLPYQLKRLTKRASLGIAQLGGIGGNSSGDIFLAFSTANVDEASIVDKTSKVEMLPNEMMNPLFEATIQATEEAIINALTAAETMTGYNGNTVYALPHDRLREALKKYNRLAETTRK